MIKDHLPYFPKRIPVTLTLPETTLYTNLEITAKRYPHKKAISYYGSSMTFSELLNEVDELAGYLQYDLHVKKGDRVLLYMQNSPQFIIGYYAILRADAAVVPINPMNTADELSFFVKDCGIRKAVAGQELIGNMMQLVKEGTIEDTVVAAYSDYASAEHIMEQPEAVRAERKAFDDRGFHLWKEALAAKRRPMEAAAGPDDLAVLPYTSGTTGLPKGCMHSHRTVQANTFGGYHWLNATSDAVSLATLPLFHVTGMVHSMHIPILSGAEMVVMTRWDRETARKTIKEKKVNHWVTISTMLIDFLANPELRREDVSSLMCLAGGGAALPAAVGEKLTRMTGLKFVEGYGLSETIAQTHFNPADRPKLQCLGIPSFDVDARIIDPVSGEELPAGAEGEIVVNGPQVFLGYYNRPEENEHSFIELEGKRFFRTGDIGRRDEEGYYFMVDRVKRMINASGFKVWPTEVESLLYRHPAVEQACVVGIPDERRGETVKAFVVLSKDALGTSEAEIIEWAKGEMAAYKYPRVIEFRESLPMTSSGKLLWRKLQEEEKQKIGEVIK
ncbi:long-chain fatty acid--CoA ligase [Metabacillus sp. GX 13764]|uniref:long-chain fatty acid--CoA ligase n=1 Tax=Metabacillus kandeliae TaxID=2900151 RepID=UPI001E3A6932|nr:long-chain fatty acid--CoA ligase [Metabacillus kandeliae]MCD7032702.1 long-chain fatty acid--CoA ligase [Metabacillus kandeliae]